LVAFRGRPEGNSDLQKGNQGISKQHRRETVMAISQELLDLLHEAIFCNTERPDKITVTADPVSRSITVVYEDMDQQDYEEITESL
jgi:hypothetical protein